MIGTIEMTWTAIIEKNGEVKSVTFNSAYSPDEAYRNIHKVVECDGYEVVGLLKGDHTNNFYSLNESGTMRQATF